VEEQKEAEAQKAEAEWREHLAQEKAVQEVVVMEEQQQSLATGLLGLKLTIPAPASIARIASGSSTQSKGKRKATEENLSVSQYVLLFSFCSLLTFSGGRGFPHVIHAQSLVFLVQQRCRRTEHSGCHVIAVGNGRWPAIGIWWV
jgi:hypothetical protein